MIKLGFLGFESNVESSICIALKNRAAQLCECSSSAEAEVVMVDLDNIQDQSQWQALRQSGNIKLIGASSVREQAIGGLSDFSGFVSKPVRFTQLLEQINLLTGASASQAIVDTAQRADLINAEAQKPRQQNVERNSHLIDPQLYLLGVILNLLQQTEKAPLQRINLALERHDSEGKWLLLDTRKRKLYSSVSAKVLSHTALMELKHLPDPQPQAVSDSDLADYQQRAVLVLELETFVWNLTRDTIRNGQLKTLDPERRYRLKFWPNLTRVNEGNQAIALSSFWQANRVSARQLAEQFKLPETEVYRFAACCMNCDLLEAETPESAPPPAQTRGGLKKVLSMILKKLDQS